MNELCPDPAQTGEHEAPERRLGFDSEDHLVAVADLFLHHEGVTSREQVRRRGLDSRLRRDVQDDSSELRLVGDPVVGKLEDHGKADLRGSGDRLCRRAHNEVTNDVEAGACMSPRAELPPRRSRPPLRQRLARSPNSSRLGNRGGRGLIACARWPRALRPSAKPERTTIPSSRSRSISSGDGVPPTPSRRTNILSELRAALRANLSAPPAARLLAPVGPTLKSATCTTMSTSGSAASALAMAGTAESGSATPHLSNGFCAGKKGGRKLFRSEIVVGHRLA